MTIQANKQRVQEEDIAVLWRNHYQCPHCQHEWQDIWSAQVDEECIACGMRDISPIFSEDI